MPMSSGPTNNRLTAVMDDENHAQARVAHGKDDAFLDRGQHAGAAARPTRTARRAGCRLWPAADQPERDQRNQEGESVEQEGHAYAGQLWQ